MPAKKIEKQNIRDGRQPGFEEIFPKQMDHTAQPSERDPKTTHAGNEHRKRREENRD